MDLLTIEDIIPKGNFYSELTGNQVRALQLVREIGNRLISNHPEIADLYRHGSEFQTYLKVAEQYLPEAERFPQVASRAVGYAIRQLIPPEELAKIRKTRRAKRLGDIFEGFDSEQFREHCRNAATRRHELGIGVDINAMIKARGRTPWTEDEKREALDLSNNQDYQHQRGQHKGRPDYELIALALNIKYHNCEEVRYANSVASFVKDTRRKAR